MSRPPFSGFRRHWPDPRTGKLIVQDVALPPQTERIAVGGIGASTIGHMAPRKLSGIDEVARATERQAPMGPTRPPRYAG